MTTTQRVFYIVFSLFMVLNALITPHELRSLAMVVMLGFMMIDLNLTVLINKKMSFTNENTINIDENVIKSANRVMKNSQARAREKFDATPKE